MQLVRDAAAFVAEPIGRAVAGATYLVWCHGPALIGSIHWGVPTERDLPGLIAALDVITHPAIDRCAVLMDDRAIERVDAEVLLAFATRSRERLPSWAPRIRAQAVVVPEGLPAILIAGVLSTLAPRYPFQFVTTLDEALGFLAHPDAREAHAAASVLAAEVRVEPEVIALVRAALARDLVDATVERIAAAVHRSPRTLQRELTEAKTSFSAELRGARVAAAVELLRMTELKIEAIAVRVGLGTASRMSEVLRRDVGASASEVRARGRR